MESGIYIAGYNNNCTNKPQESVFEFYLEVLKGAGNNRIQRYTERGTGAVYIRSYDYLVTDYGWREWQQIATKSDLAKYINTRWTEITSSASLAYTGKSITIPAGKGYSLRFENIYVLAEPRQIGVSESPNAQGDNSWDYLALSPEGSSKISLNGYATEETTLYIYAKSSHATANGCWIAVNGYIM